MAKQTEKPPAPRPRRASPIDGGETSTWPVWLRVVLTIVILWHCFVLAACPFFFATESQLGSSELARSVVRNPLVQCYADTLYLNSGYGFFGPEPPLTNGVISYVVLDESGAEIASGRFPDLRDQWPRLWYHRFMMLSDQASIPFERLSPEQAHQLTLKSFARHVLRAHGGARVDLTHQNKLLLMPADVLAGEDALNKKFALEPTTVSVSAADLNEPLIPKQQEWTQPEEIPGGRLP
ncbi:hypothetical protein Pla175_17290 [Pirellulimonas nuda]|uniref:Uncharacterized protein n=1 Tax=Pirellulimonas nuda TaxID=2528009 RepID=A0A518DA43_9BACT|nr:hypothetical protein [Pirellulimonas nuda]QDU88354.1 hypothetical protein Pla175_17290 [Pirellulimonas nuda]